MDTPKKPRPNQRSCCSAIEKTTVEYAGASTTHGISYVFEEGQLCIERFLWLCAVIVAVFLAIYLSVQAYINWQDNPVITSLSTTSLPVESVPFPAITICGQGLVKDIVTAAIFKQWSAYNDKKDDSKPISNMTQTEKDVEYKKFLDDKFNGLEPADVIFLMTLPDPEASVAAAAAAAASPPPINGKIGYCYKYKAGSNSNTCSAANSVKPSDLYEAGEQKNFGDIPLADTYYSKDALEDDVVSVTGFFGLPLDADGLPGISAIVSVSPKTSAASKLTDLPCRASPTTSITCLRTDGETKVETPPEPPAKNEVKPPKVDKYFNPEELEKMANTTTEKKSASLKSFEVLDLQKSYNDLFEIMWYSQLPCFDVNGVTSRKRDQSAMVKRCIWKGMPINCASIFKTFPTDRGMCCTFNMANVDDMFKESDYSKMVKTMQENDLSLSFGEKKPPKWYQDNKEPKSTVGKNKGLTLVLDGHTNIVAPGTISDDTRGFFAVVEDKGKYPLVNDGSQLLQSGYSTFFAISATSIEANADIRSVSASKRNCYFNDEVDLKLHKNYTRSNCLFECKLTYAFEQTNKVCTPWYFPSEPGGKTQPCDPWQTQDFLAKMAAIPDDQCNHCLPDCITTVYETSVTSAHFRRCDNKNLGASPLCKLDVDKVALPPIWAQQVKEDYVNTLGVMPSYIGQSLSQTNKRRHAEERNVLFASLDNTDRYYNAYEDDIAVAHFFFNSPTAFQFEKAARMTFLDYISQIGGLLGLFIGFSVISGIEIIYWLTFRLAKNKRGKVEPEVDKNDSMNIMMVQPALYEPPKTAGGHNVPPPEVNKLGESMRSIDRPATTSSEVSSRSRSAESGSKVVV